MEYVNEVQKIISFILNGNYSSQPTHGYDT